MKILSISLQDSDKAVLMEMARFWGVSDALRLDVRVLCNAIHTAMTTPETAERIWDKLTDAQRGVMQTLLGAEGQKMPLPMFERLHGTIRKMGAGSIDREKPLENPASIAEGLFYRGLIYESYEKARSGMRPMVYIPPELVQSLPAHKTSYDASAAHPAGGDTPHSAPHFAPHFAPHPGGEELEIERVDADSLDNISPADTSIVDDMTALLAYLRIYGAGVTPGSDLDAKARDDDKLRGQLIDTDSARLTFLFQLAVSAGLVEIHQHDASLKVAESRRWLESKRAAQLKWLVDSWKKSTLYLDLWHVPGLFPEPTGWPYNPVVGREALAGFLQELVPRSEWWSLDTFINVIRETEPDFQRPGGGDYESWYIRNADGEYLSGFESWDAVEGAQILFYFSGPMHWLGLADVAEDAARLTAYGRAFAGVEAWPSPPEEIDPVIVQDDGVLLVSRRVLRIDRFQIMRFTTWEATTAPPYRYRLDAAGIQQSAEQGITTAHIAAFLARVAGGAPVPQDITRLLETWRTGPSAHITLERLVVLRTTSTETLDFIVETPALRRYLGARLGEMAVVVRADQWDALIQALGEHGIEIDNRL